MAKFTGISLIKFLKEVPFNDRDELIARSDDNTRLRARVIFYGLWANAGRSGSSLKWKTVAARHCRIMEEKG